MNVGTYLYNGREKFDNGSESYDENDIPKAKISRRLWKRIRKDDYDRQ